MTDEYEKTLKEIEACLADHEDGAGYLWDAMQTKHGRVVLKALKAMSVQWQPIETAPKDGTRVLLRYFKGNRVNGWTKFYKCFCVTEGYYENMERYGGRHVEKHEWRDYAGRLISKVGATTSKNYVCEWMPLPQPPEA